MTQPLLTRIESARDPTRELFWDVYDRVIGSGDQGPLHHRFSQLLGVEAWEQAALLLVPEGWLGDVFASHDDGLFRVELHQAHRRDCFVRGTGKTEALALLAAILRASEVKNG